MAAANSRDKINEETVRKAVNALLKWKKKKLQSQLQSEAHLGEQEQEGDDDDFMYLSITLKKTSPKDLTLTPHKIPLPHPLLPHQDHTFCLIVDGKRITVESAHKILKSQDFPFIKQVVKLPKLKSDYKSFESKKKLYDSFDVFLATRKVEPLLPKVLGKVFYKKKRKVPVPLDLRVDGSNWKEEIGKACESSLLCLSGGTCSTVRVGRRGVMEGEDIVENVFEAVDGVLGIVPKKWGGIRCLHLRFSDSVALPIYEPQYALQAKRGDIGGVGDYGAGVVGVKRKATEVVVGSGRKI